MTSIGIVALMFAAALYTRLQPKQRAKAHPSLKVPQDSHVAVGGVHRLG